MKKKMWGCDEPLQVPEVFDGENIFRCPLRPYYEKPQFFDAVFAEYAYNNRWGWPEDGGWKDQPNLLVELFDVIELAKQDAQDYKDVKERKRKAAAQTFGTADNRKK